MTSTAPTSPPARSRRWPRMLAAGAVLLLVLTAAGVLLLDRLLTSAAREQATRLGATWQRPVELGAVRTTWLGGLGVRIESVRIGAGAGEPRPLLELDRAEVKLELLRALRSGGRELQIRSAELKGLRVNVVKGKDGTTNLERLTDAMERAQPPAPATPSQGAVPPAAPADLSRIRVDHAALLGARVAFLDEASPGAELAVEAIDVTLDGLAAGAPLQVVLKAGLLSKTQNLRLDLHAPPLPPSLVPAPDRLKLVVEPLDLTPLAPFLPRRAGFQGGRFSADLEVALGAAVPGGAGPTTLRGGFRAGGLRFAGQQGGKALDVTLDADLSADAAKGDLDLKRLLLAFGPASLEGGGRASALLSGSPRIEGLRLTARNLDLEAVKPYYPPLGGLLGGTVAGPIGLTLQAAGTADRPHLELRADLAPVHLSFPKRLEKAAGAPLTAVARLRGGDGGALRFELEADLSGLDLRPGGTLDKRPGDRFKLSVSGTRTASGATSRLEVGALALALVDMNLKGRGTVDQAPGRTRFDLAAEIDRLDSDRLLLAAPPGREAAPPPSKATAGASPWAGLAGSLDLRVGEASAKRQKVTAVHAAVKLEEDRVTLGEARFGLWSGTVQLDGTQVRLAPADRPFQLKARAAGLQLAALLAAFTDKKVAEGRLDAEVQLAGKGEGSAAILNSLDGTVDGKLLDGLFQGKDLEAEVVEPLARVVPSFRGSATRGGTTSLGKEVPFSLRVQGGRAQLQRPLEVTTRRSTLSAQGSFSFDGDLDLPSRLALSPAAVTELTGGKVRLDAPLPFAFKVEGKAWSPRVTGLDLAPALKSLTAKQVDAAKKSLEDEGKKALQRLFGK
jgi:AsmA protein